MLHALMQNLYRSSHRAHYPAADNPLSQLQVVKAEQVDAFIKIEQALGHIMQAKEFLVTAIQIVHAYTSLAQLSVESFAQPRADVEQGEEAGRIQAAAMSEPGTNQVVVMRSDRLQLVQHGDRIFQHVITAA